MSDWLNADVAIQVNADSTLVKPPVIGVVVTSVLAVGSAAFLFSNSFVGYLVTVLASLVGGFTTFVDQKRRGSANYVMYRWFVVALPAARYCAVAMALVHIARQSIHAFHGSGIFG